MTSDPAPRSDTSHQLGVLAMRFRRTRDEAVRRAIAAEYAREVQRLIETGNWAEAPAFEDQLPDEWMPEAFVAYWSKSGRLRGRSDLIGNRHKGF